LTAVAVVRAFEDDDYSPEFGLAVLRDSGGRPEPEDAGPPHESECEDEQGELAVRFCALPIPS
jgi:hypothetical protein